MEALKIICLGVAAAIVYGIVHDQITARICVEYFTIGHAPIFGTDDPTLLGIAWGITATWWLGLFLGCGLALIARVGRRPKRDADSLVRPILLLLGVMAVCAAIAGLAGWLLARGGIVWLLEPLASRVPRDRHALFLADAWAHSASYLIAFLGGNVMLVRVWLSRGRSQPRKG